MDLTTIYEYARLPQGILEQDLLVIPEHLQSLDVDLDNHRNEIPRLLNQPQSPRLESAQNKATAFDSLYPPIRRLPNELHVQIFDHVCENAIDCLVRSYELSKAPFHLSAVCSHWRSLCLSYPKMWANFAVECEKGTELESAIDLHLERSKQQLLTLRIAYHPNIWDNRAGNNVLWQKVVNCHARWRHVKLSLSFLSPKFPHLSGLEFPALESLDLDPAREDKNGLDVFARSPKLNMLKARRLRFPNQKVLRQITNLWYSMDSGNLRRVVNLCSNLHALVVKDYHDTGYWSESETEDPDSELYAAGPPTVIPAVTSLHVVGGEYSGRALPLLITPALTTLKVEHHVQSNGATCLHVEQFLDRSGCSLTSLIIRASWADETVVGLLQRLPLLKELTLHDFRTSNHRNCSRPITKLFTESLHSRQQSHLHLVPKLHSLSLDVASTEFDHKSFVEMILSRWIPDKDYAASIGVSCIRSVELRLPERVDKAEYLPLVRLRKMGLCFTLQ
ncbi:hypothetical protein GYMLUDRAFT_237175 [Collybiopsis luxurians FD-317 M1]|nr:hypothetical protein GYMLUDRAFT_237175 [Collybiopsis luxurians FD-317 M1]